MPDVFTKEKRSEVMRLVRSKNSKAELAAFSYLRREKVYFQKHYKGAPGTPDIALPRKKKAVFIDGDFWHGRRLQELLDGRGEDDYWTKKIVGNIERDKRQRAELGRLGWRVLVVWESDINRKRTRVETLDSVVAFLKT